MNKSTVRKEVFERLKGLNSKERKEKSDIIKEKLFSLSEYKKAEVVLFYVSMSLEVNTWDMIRESIKIGKRICLPVIVSSDKMLASEIKDLNKELKKGRLGIYQPKLEYLRPLNEGSINLAIVPGVAFDKSNYRIGHGKGFYDRFLKKLSPGITTIGLAFKCQFFESLPKNLHDIPVSKLIVA